MAVQDNANEMQTVSATEPQAIRSKPDTDQSYDTAEMNERCENYLVDYRENESGQNFEAFYSENADTVLSNQKQVTP